MNPSIRHWKERMKTGAPVVFLKRILYAGTQYEPGDVVPESVLQNLGPHRAKLWWESRQIRLATAAEIEAAFKLPEPKPETATVTETGTATETATVTETGTATATEPDPVEQGLEQVMTEEATEPEVVEPQAPKPKRKPLGKKPQ